MRYLRYLDIDLKFVIYCQITELKWISSLEFAKKVVGK